MSRDAGSRRLRGGGTTTTSPKRLGRGLARAATAALLVGLWPARAMAPGFDVTLEVPPAPPPDPGPLPPELAFTGAPLWVLIALAVLLLATGLLTNEAAQRRAAEAS